MIDEMIDENTQYFLKNIAERRKVTKSNPLPHSNHPVGLYSSFYHAIIRVL